MASRTASLKPPLLILPGDLAQLPQTVVRHTYQVLTNLQQNKISVSAFPLAITQPVSGNILVFNGSAWANQDWIPVAFGFGKAPVAGQLLTLNPTSNQAGLVVSLAVSPAKNAFDIKDSTGLSLLHLDAAGNLFLLKSETIDQNLTVSGSFQVGGTTTLSGALNLLADLSVAGNSVLEGSLAAGSTTLGSLTVTGGTTLHSLEALASGQFDGNLLVIGNTTLEGSLSTGPATFNSITVTGTTLLDGNTTLLGNLVDLGTFSAGASTVNSLAVTGTVNVSGFLTAGQASFAATNLHSVVLTNSGIGGLKLAQASGNIKRVVINLNTLYQFGTDLNFNGGSDFWFQNLATGNAVITIDGNDKIAMGSTNTSGGVIIGASSGKASFYGSTPVVKPTITGSTAANAALQNLLSALATQGLIINSTT